MTHRKRPQSDAALPGQSGGTRRGFTLIELLVSIGILAILLSLLLPAATGTVAAARGFKCQMAQRSIAFDFQVFADEKLHGNRGHDAPLGDRSFRLETFQDSQYGIDEFWAWGSDAVEVRMPDASGADPMRCPEVDGEVVLRSMTPCTQGAISPPSRVSYSFNLRLHRPEVRASSGRWVMGSPVPLDSSIVQATDVPLFWDVDGAAAEASGVTPVFSAPPLESTGPIGSGVFWFPAMRHNGSANFAFVDGSVRKSDRPLEENWRWDYQPRR